MTNKERRLKKKKLIRDYRRGYSEFLEIINKALYPYKGAREEAIDRLDRLSGRVG